jgi:hypothetical protein
VIFVDAVTQLDASSLATVNVITSHYYYFFLNFDAFVMLVNYVLLVVVLMHPIWLIY